MSSFDALETRLNDLVVSKPQAANAGSPSEAIDSVVQRVADDIRAEITALRKQLDAMEQEVLETAADTKHRLLDFVSVCGRVNGEVQHVKQVIAEISDGRR